jgi:hypothetical protein
MPENPIMPPRIASNMLSGRLLGNPTSRNIICITSIIIMLEDPIVAVRDAPILLSPVEYESEPIKGSSENNSMTTVMKTICWLYWMYGVSIDVSCVGPCCCISLNNVTTIKDPISIKPEISIEVDATSMDECLETSLVRKRTPNANPNAESIASRSPKVMINGDEDDDDDENSISFQPIFSPSTLVVESLITAKMNPNNATAIPMM